MRSANMTVSTDASRKLRPTSQSIVLLAGPNGPAPGTAENGAVPVRIPATVSPIAKRTELRPRAEPTGAGRTALSVIGCSHQVTGRGFHATVTAPGGQVNRGRAARYSPRLFKPSVWIFFRSVLRLMPRMAAA